MPSTKNADVSTFNTNHLTPLAYATRMHISSIQLLLTAKVNLDAKDHTGPTPLHYAALSNETEGVMEKAEMKDTEILKLLMDSRADCNMPNYYGIVKP